MILLQSGRDLSGFGHPNVWCLVDPAQGSTSLSPARPTARGTGHPQRQLAQSCCCGLSFRQEICTVKVFFQKKPRIPSTLFVSGEHCSGDEHWLGAGVMSLLVPNSYRPRWRKEHGKASPHPGVQAQPSVPWEKPQSWFIILFLCTTVSINKADLWVRNFLAVAGAPQNPCPRTPGQPGRAWSAPGAARTAAHLQD